MGELMIRIFLVLIGLTSFGFKVFAADEIIAGKQYDDAKETEIAKKVKKRLYVGGRDESDLKVQTQLMTPIRKIAPQAEVKAEEPAEE